MMTTGLILWFVVMTGSAFELSKDKNAVSPFVVLAMMLAMVFFVAFIDPSKWRFVIALSVSFVLFISGAIYDNKKKKSKEKEL